jgi:hypothetical protein
MRMTEQTFAKFLTFVIAVGLFLFGSMFGYSIAIIASSVDVPNQSYIGGLIISTFLSIVFLGVLYLILKET